MLWPNGSTIRPNITSAYGLRRHPITGKRRLHAGVDLTGFTTVRAIAAGVVVAVGTPAGWTAGGTQVWIQHDGFLSRSMHLVKGSPVVRVGQHVDERDALATMGRSGSATGVHLHLEVVSGGRQIDPVPFIAVRLTPATSGGGSTPTEEEEEDMYLADVMGSWYLVLGKDAHVLHAKSEASKSGIPIIRYPDEWAKKQLVAGGVRGIK